MRRFVPGLWKGATVVAVLLLTGCGRQYVVLHPAGPVAATELHLMSTASVFMAAVILLVLVLFGIVLVRFRDTPGNKSPYTPRRSGSPRLELVLFLIPIAIIVAIAIPTVSTTVALGQKPPAKKTLVIDVTSLTWKWLFEYPGQHVATINYVEIPTGRPVIFELTADSPMNAFWVPQLGGMEITMPGRVLPLWLEAARPGTYLGRSSNFSGKDFAKMTFEVHAVSPAAFNAWAKRVQAASPPLTMTAYRGLLRHGTTQVASFSSYPAATFPRTTDGFTVEGGIYSSATAKQGGVTK